LLTYEHECQANRFARECLRESIEYARRRKAFGKKLEDQPVVRQKIANMARYDCLSVLLLVVPLVD
jgi:alkylation response protein AidB-like acyl-CoA dehydrogenase